MKLYLLYTIFGAYNFLKIFGKLSYFWPVKCKSRLMQIIVDSIFIIVVINHFFILYCAVSKLFSRTSITSDLIHNIFQLIVFIEILFNLLYSKFRETQFKTILRKLSRYLNETSNHEKDILNKYMLKRLPIDVYLLIIYFLACVAFIFGPIFLKNKKFPLDLMYPFSVESTGTYAIIYIHQVIASLQSFIILIFDFTAKFFLWTFAARFELLQHDFQYIGSEKQLKLTIQKHQSLLRDTEEAVDFTKYVAFKVFASITVVLITSTLQIDRNSSITIIVQFILAGNIAAFRSFSYCWDADDLMEKSAGLAWHIYKCAWIEHSNRIRTDVLIIIQRCQKPIVVKISGFIPKLSFNFCVSYFYMVYSAFMALRAFL